MHHITLDVYVAEAQRILGGQIEEGHTYLCAEDCRELGTTQW
jgi:hypothetical protein